jgi:hypothetical protein
MTAATGGAPGRPKGVGTPPPTDNSADGIPEAPRELKVKGKKEWTRIWEAGKWLHRTQHYMLVANYCQKVDEIAEWQTTLNYFKKQNKEKLGVALDVYLPSNGQWAPYPQVRLIHEGRAQLTAMLREMKLSPSNLPEDTGTDELVEAMRKPDRGHRATL